MNLGLPDFTIFIQFFLFLGTFLVLNFWVFGPLLKVVEDRRNKTIVTLKEADKLTKHAGQVLHDYETKLRSHKVFLHEKLEKVHSEVNKTVAQEVLRTKEALQKNLKEQQKALSTKAVQSRTELEKEFHLVAHEIVQKMLGPVSL